MNIIDKLLQEIKNSEIKSIDWKVKKFQIKDGEEKIGTADDFELKCLAFLEKRQAEHEKSHEEIKTLFNVPDGDIKKIHKVFERRKKDPNFMNALQKLQCSCKRHQEERRLVCEMLWYSVAEKFPEKNIDAIFVREKGVIIFSQRQDEIIKMEKLHDVIREGLTEALEGIFVSHQEHFNFMNFGTPQGEA
ncbi:MAG: hypothetical protein WCO58_00200 [bacterium]